MLQLTDYESKSLENFEKAIIEGKFSEAALVQFFELTGMYLNVQSPAEYARKNGITYNGMKKQNKIRSVNGIKYIPFD